MTPKERAKRKARLNLLRAELRALGLCIDCRKADRLPAVKAGRCAEHYAAGRVATADYIRRTVQRRASRGERPQLEDFAEAYDPADADELDRGILARGYLGTWLGD